MWFPIVNSMLVQICSRLALSMMTSKGEGACAVNGFHGCYLLLSLNPRCNGRIYIGYTVNPKRRIQQHNSGVTGGGAKKTCGKGPW